MRAMSHTVHQHLSAAIALEAKHRQYHWLPRSSRHLIHRTPRVSHAQARLHRFSSSGMLGHSSELRPNKRCIRNNRAPSTFRRQGSIKITDCVRRTCSWHNGALLRLACSQTEVRHHAEGGGSTLAESTRPTNNNQRPSFEPAHPQYHICPSHMAAFFDTFSTHRVIPRCAHCMGG